MENTGTIYDVNSLDRVKTWVYEQQEQFEAADSEKNKKEWIVISGIVVLSSLIILFTLKKIAK